MWGHITSIFIHLGEAGFGSEQDHEELMASCLLCAASEELALMSTKQIVLPAIEVESVSRDPSSLTPLEGMGMEWSK